MSRRTTVGQLLVSRELPEDIRDKFRNLDRDGLDGLMKTLATRDPDEYRRVTFGLQKVGAEIAYRAGGASFGPRHMAQTPEMRERRKELDGKVREILETPDLGDDERDERIVQTLSDFQGQESKRLLAEAGKAGNPLALQVISGARGSAANLAALIGGDVMYQDARERPIPIPVLRGFSQGLKPAEYWAATYGARRSMIDVKLGVQNAGDLGKQLARAAHRAVVIGLDDDEDEDGKPKKDLTLRGLPVDTDDADNEGALLASPAGRFARNTVLTRQHLDELRDAGIKRILVRSPAVRQSEDGGVWARDVGVREFGRLPRTGEFPGVTAAQALSEPLTQMSLGAKHGGGVAKKKLERSGFKYLDQILQVPKVFPGGAAHAEEDGPVLAVDKAPAGGWNVRVGNSTHYVPPDQKVSVKPGDKVEAGDLLSDGIPNPARIVRLKGIGEGRRYLATALRDAIKNSGLKANRRNAELVVGKLVNHVELDDEVGDFVPGDVVPYSALEARWKPRTGFQSVDPSQAVGWHLERPYLHHTIGTRITRRVADDLREFGVNRVDAHQDPPPFHPEMIRTEANIQYDPDWMTRFLGVGLKATTLKEVHRGGTSDAGSTSYVPALALAKGFGQTGVIHTPDSSPARPDEMPKPPPPPRSMPVKAAENSAQAEFPKAGFELPALPSMGSLMAPVKSFGQSIAERWNSLAPSAKKDLITLGGSIGLGAGLSSADAALSAEPGYRLEAAKRKAFRGALSGLSGFAAYKGTQRLLQEDPDRPVWSALAGLGAGAASDMLSMTGYPLERAIFGRPSWDVVTSDLDKLRRQIRQIRKNQEEEEKRRRGRVPGLKTADVANDALVDAQSRPFQSLPQETPAAGHNPFFLQMATGLYPQLPSVLSKLGPLGLLGYGALLSPRDLGLLMAGALPAELRKKLEDSQSADRSPSGEAPAAAPGNDGTIGVDGGPAVAAPAGGPTEVAPAGPQPVFTSGEGIPDEPWAYAPGGIHGVGGKGYRAPVSMSEDTKAERESRRAALADWMMHFRREQLRQGTPQLAAYRDLVASALLGRDEPTVDPGVLAGIAAKHGVSPEFMDEAVMLLKARHGVTNDEYARRLFSREIEPLDPARRSNMTADWAELHPDKNEKDWRDLAAVDDSVQPPEGLSPEAWEAARAKAREVVGASDNLSKWIRDWDLSTGFPDATTVPGLSDYLRMRYPEDPAAVANDRLRNAVREQARRSMGTWQGEGKTSFPEVLDRAIQSIRDQDFRKNLPKDQDGRSDFSVWHGVDTPWGASAAADPRSRFLRLRDIARSRGEESALQILDRAADDYQKGIEATGDRVPGAEKTRADAFKEQWTPLLRSPMVQGLPLVGTLGRRWGMTPSQRTADVQKIMEPALGELVGKNTLAIPDSQLDPLVLRIADQLGEGAGQFDPAAIRSMLRQAVSRRAVDQQLGQTRRGYGDTAESLLDMLGEEGTGLVSQVGAGTLAAAKRKAEGFAGSGLPGWAVGTEAVLSPFIGPVQGMAAMPGTREIQEVAASPVLAAAGGLRDVFAGSRAIPDKRMAVPRAYGAVGDVAAAPFRMLDRHLGTRLTQDDPSYRGDLEDSANSRMAAGSSPGSPVELARSIVDTERSYDMVRKALDGMSPEQQARWLDSQAGSKNGLELIRTLAAHERRVRSGRNLADWESLLGGNYPQAIQALRQNLPEALRQRGYAIDPNMTDRDWNHLAVSMAVGKVPDSIAQAFPTDEKGNPSLDVGQLFGGKLGGTSQAGWAGRNWTWARGALTHGGLALADLPVGMAAVKSPTIANPVGNYAVQRLGSAVLSPAGQTAEQLISDSRRQAVMPGVQQLYVDQFGGAARSRDTLSRSARPLVNPTVTPLDPQTTAPGRAPDNMEKWRTFRSGVPAPAPAPAPAASAVPKIPGVPKVPAAPGPKPLIGPGASPAAVGRSVLPGADTSGK